MPGMAENAIRKLELVGRWTQMQKKTNRPVLRAPPNQTENNGKESHLQRKKCQIGMNI